MTDKPAQPLFTNIVVGTDGTEHGTKAVIAAIELAATNPDAKLHIVMAFHPLSTRELAAVSAELPEEYRSILHSRYPAESTLGEARRLTEAHGVDATFHEVDDDPTDAILGLVADVGADLVVVGTRGLGPAGRVMHGSVSTKLLHNTPCSLLVVV